MRLVSPSGGVSTVTDGGSFFGGTTVSMYSGWIAPPAGDWLVVLGERKTAVVASGRRGVLDVGALIADRVEASVVAVQVRRDRQLSIVGWQAGAEVGRYCSDPSLEAGADEDVLSEPVGIASAAERLLRRRRGKIGDAGGRPAPGAKAPRPTSSWKYRAISQALNGGGVGGIKPAARNTPVIKRLLPREGYG